MTNRRKLIAGIAVLTIIALAGTAHAQDRRHYHGGSNAAGWAALGAIVGLGVAGAAIAATAPPVYAAPPQYVQYPPYPVYAQVPVVQQQVYAPPPVYYAAPPVVYYRR